MPVAMKVSVAAIERGERRAMPQTPWPLVQPEPRRLPKPTIRPASTMRTGGVSMRAAGSGANSAHRVGAARMPSRKAKRQARSAHGLRAQALAMMPLTPAMRPSASARMSAESPIRAPPRAALPGVKWVQSICMEAVLAGAVLLVEYVEQGEHRGVGNAVEDVLAGPTGADQPFLAEYRQLLREGGLMQIEQGFQLTDAALAQAQLAEQEQAVFVGHDAKQGGGPTGGSAHGIDVQGNHSGWHKC